MEHYSFRLPDVGEGVAEAEITAWHVKVGDMLAEDQLMVDVMTDKATVEMTSPLAGRVVAIHGDIGQRVPVGSKLIDLDTSMSIGTEPIQAAVTIAQTDAIVRVAPPPLVQPIQQAEPRRLSLPPTVSRSAPLARRPVDAPLAAPATRKRAYDLGIPLQFVAGSGPAGRIMFDDIDRHLSSGTTAQSNAMGMSARNGVAEVRLVGLRRKIAEKMQEAKRRIPHFTYVEEFDLTELEVLRRTLNESSQSDRPKLTLLPFFKRAVAALVSDFPQINARFDDEAGILRTYEGVHIGIATQTIGGLMVPVVRHVEARTLFDCAAELSRVTSAARDGKAPRDELTGSTITLTSLGALGGIAATPVINHPEVAIIGPNKLVERPVAHLGSISLRKMMNVSSSFDHRIVDGYDAARFIQRLKQLIEQPALLFMDTH